MPWGEGREKDQRWECSQLQAAAEADKVGFTPSRKPTPYPLP